MLVVLWIGNKLRYPEEASRKMWASPGQGRKSPVQKYRVQDETRKRRDLSLVPCHLWRRWMDSSVVGLSIAALECATAVTRQEEPCWVAVAV